MKQYIVVIIVLICLLCQPIIGGGKAQSSYQTRTPGLVEKLTKLLDQREEKLLQKLTVFENIICSMKIRCEQPDASVWTNSVQSAMCPRYKLFIKSDKCSTHHSI